MQIVALVLGIAGGLLGLLVNLLGYGLGGIAAAWGAGGAGLFQLASLAVPILGLVGAGLAISSPAAGGVLMLLSAAGMLGFFGYIFGFGVLVAFSCLLAGLGGVLAVAADLTGFLFMIDALSTWVGKAFGWMILVLTLGVSYEVFMRYLVRWPTTWAFDFSYITYGALFLMAGAYTLARNGHVRADVLYRFWRPRTQAFMDLLLYVFFFLPAVVAFIYSGWIFAQFSVRFLEVSIYSPAGIPVFPLKALIPLTGVLLLFQGIAEIIRCVLCIRRGEWPQRLHDVEETESMILREQQLQRERGEAVQPLPGHGGAGQ